MKGCRSCNHWQTQGIALDRVDPSTAGQKAQLGLCRRYAPRPGPSQANGAPEVLEGAASPWPCVASDDWCGEWEPNFH